MWQPIASIVGILGFLLSLALAILRWSDARPRISCANARIASDQLFNQPDLQGMAAVMSFDCSNRSSRTVSILSAAFELGTGQTWSCAQVAPLVGSAPQIPRPYQSSVFGSLSPFPVNLPPHCTLRIVVLAQSRESNSLLNNLATAHSLADQSASSHSGSAQSGRHTPLASATHTMEVPIRVRTPQRELRVVLSADIV